MLKRFIELGISLSGAWTSHGGRTKQFNDFADSIVIKCNQNTSSLQIQGGKGDELRDILTKAVFSRKQTVAGDDGVRSEGCETGHSEVIDENESRESNGASNCKHTECQCPVREIVAELKGMKHEIAILQSLIQSIAISNQIPDNGSEISRLEAEHQSVIDEMKLKASIQIDDINSEIVELSAEHQSVIKD